MPTYEYQCGKCGYQFEAFQSIKDAAITTCPECHEEAVQRLISSGSGLIFKGSGFYITDYKSKSDSSSKSSKSTRKTEKKTTKSKNPKKQD
jgi:putative FmdB family regulatory protein